MEELFANASPRSQLLYTIVNWALLGGGLLIAVALVFHGRRHPVDRKALTATIAGRSWSTPQIGIVLGALLLLYLLASFSGRLFYAEHIPLASLAIVILIYSIVIGIIVAINRRRGGSWTESCGMGWQDMRKLSIAPVLYLAFIPLLMLATKAYHLVLQKTFGMELELQEVAKVVSQELSGLQIAYVVMAIAVAPVYEELLFRGILFPYFVKRGGLLLGIVLVSGLFAAMHHHTPSFAPLFLLSAALCLAYWRTGSLWVNIGMHTIFNTVNILALNIIG